MALGFPAILTTGLVGEKSTNPMSNLRIDIMRPGAAIVFIADRHKSNLSLRKVITLADKNWASQSAYPRILISWKHYGSYFLLAAFLLNTLGAVLSPLQEILLSTKTIKTPVWTQQIVSLFDISDQFTRAYSTPNGRDLNLVTTITQNSLMTVSNVQPQSQLWQGSGFTCGTLGVVAYDTVRYVEWSIQALMPANLSQSPWRSTRACLDFSEELYITIIGSFYRVAVKTTAGYFDLPNYMNNLAPGPLLEQAPDKLCGSDCQPEGYNLSSPDISFRRATSDESNSTGISPDMYNSSLSQNTIALEGVRNKGPLLTIALALFGENSFIVSSTAFPQAYAGINFIFGEATQSEVGPINEGACIGLFPQTALLANTDGSTALSTGDLTRN
ncbi:hypothetical protein N431DRAFT_474097 [Stipitochalara longipes BDJ]|nr:hypothetical protein N431DRAFT_474097 [Stipitochalara longipes BDJ]